MTQVFCHPCFDQAVKYIGTKEPERLKDLNHKKIQRETFFKPKTPGKGKSLQSVNKKRKKYFASHAKHSSIFVEGKRNSYLRKKNMFR